MLSPHSSPSKHSYYCIHYQIGNTNAQRVYGFQIFYDNRCPQSSNWVLGPFLISFPLLFKDIELVSIIASVLRIVTPLKLKGWLVGYMSRNQSHTHISGYHVGLWCQNCFELWLFSSVPRDEHKKAQCDWEWERPAKEAHHAIPAYKQRSMLLLGSAAPAGRRRRVCWALGASAKPRAQLFREQFPPS